MLALAAIALASYFIIVQAKRLRSPVPKPGIPPSRLLIWFGRRPASSTRVPPHSAERLTWTNSILLVGALHQWGLHLDSHVSGSNTYTVTVDTSSGTPVITSSATFPLLHPWLFSPSRPSRFLPRRNFRRELQHHHQHAPHAWPQSAGSNVLSALTAAVITKSNFNMNGNGTPLIVLTQQPGPITLEACITQRSAKPTAALEPILPSLAA